MKYDANNLPPVLNNSFLSSIATFPLKSKISAKNITSISTILAVIPNPNLIHVPIIAIINTPTIGIFSPMQAATIARPNGATVFLSPCIETRRVII